MLAARLIEASATTNKTNVLALRNVIAKELSADLILSTLWYVSGPFAATMLTSVVLESHPVLSKSLCTKLVQAVGNAVYRKYYRCVDILHAALMRGTTVAYLNSNLASIMFDTVATSFQGGRGNFKTAAIMAQLLQPTLMHATWHAKQLPTELRYFIRRLCRMKCTMFLHHWYMHVVPATTTDTLCATNSMVAVALMRLPHLRQLRSMRHVQSIEKCNVLSHAVCSGAECMYNLVIKASTIMSENATIRMLRDRIALHGTDDFRRHCVGGCNVIHNSPLLVAQTMALASSRRPHKLTNVMREVYRLAGVYNATPKALPVRHAVRSTLCSALAGSILTNQYRKLEAVGPQLQYTTRAAVHVTNKILPKAHYNDPTLTAEMLLHRRLAVWRWMIEAITPDVVRQFIVDPNLLAKSSTNHAALLTSACVYYAMSHTAHTVWRDLTTGNIGYVLHDAGTYNEIVMPAESIAAAKALVLHLFSSFHSNNVSTALRAQLQQCFNGVPKLSAPHRKEWLLPVNCWYAPRKCRPWLFPQEHRQSVYLHLCMQRWVDERRTVPPIEIIDYICSFM